MIIFHSLGEAVLPESGSCVALGLFDGLHLGHREVILSAVNKAKELGLASCVFTFSTSSVLPSAKTGASWLMPDTLRDAKLREWGVDYLICPPFEEFRGLSPREYVKGILRDKMSARLVTCGENYHFGKKAAGDVADLRNLGGEYGIQVDARPMTVLEGGPISSSRIRRLIAEGEMAAANRLLGHAFAIDFEVIHGRQLGRTIQSPTINQALPDWLITPRYGVYASLATVEGQRRVSVSNIGMKPTVGSDTLLSETYIHGYDGNLYGQRILVEFLQFVRPEQKFSSIDALKNQIQNDIEVAKRVALQLEV